MNGENVQKALDWAKAHGKVTAVVIAIVAGIIIGAWLAH
jgi:hypothetical protein